MRREGGWVRSVNGFACNAYCDSSKLSQWHERERNTPLIVHVGNFTRHSVPMQGLAEVAGTADTNRSLAVVKEEHSDGANTHKPLEESLESIEPPSKQTDPSTNQPSDETSAPSDTSAAGAPCGPTTKPQYLSCDVAAGLDDVAEVVESLCVQTKATLARFRIRFLSGDFHKQVTSKRKLYGKCSVATIGSHHVHYLQKHSHLSRVLTPGARVVAEGGKYLVQLKPEHVIKFEEAVTGWAHEGGFASDREPRGVVEGHLAFVVPPIDLESS
jgi:hypothetical protein